MARNFPGPYELRFTYETDVSGITLNHTQRVSLDLVAPPSAGDAFNNINAITRGGSAQPDLAAACEAWLALIAERFAVGVVFGIIELWKYAPLTFDATFISSYNPTLVAGVATGSVVVTQQETYTFRTVEGGVMRLQLMESVFASNDKNAYPTGVAVVDAIFDFVKSDVNWVLARDTSYPFAALNHLGGQNEKLFRLRFR